MTSGGTTQPAGCAVAGQLAKHYEGAREQWLDFGAHAPARGLGLAVLIRRGLSSWVAAWTKGTQSPDLGPVAARGVTSPGFADGVHREIARMLAGMALASREEIAQ